MPVAAKPSRMAALLQPLVILLLHLWWQGAALQECGELVIIILRQPAQRRDLHPNPAIFAGLQRLLRVLDGPVCGCFQEEFPPTCPPLKALGDEGEETRHNRADGCRGQNDREIHNGFPPPVVARPLLSKDDEFVLGGRHGGASLMAELPILRTDQDRAIRFKPPLPDESAG
jgi:hypothetical protein